MSIDFDNIFQHVIPMDDFRLKWRFTEEKYDKLPDQHLDQLKPLDNEAAKFLWDYIAKTNLHNNIPFKKDFFRTIDKARISDGNEKEIKKWLYQRGLPFDKPVFLSWQPTDENHPRRIGWRFSRGRNGRNESKSQNKKMGRKNATTL